MRLTIEQKEAIKTVFKQVFTQGKVILFGSRVDDTKRGGDIDLFIDTQQNTQNLFTLKIEFLVKLKNKIGSQKIDLVLAPFVSLDFKKEIKEKGVLLCQI